MHNDVLLFQTDTTVGLASQNASRLIAIKSRPPHKPFLKLYSNFNDLDIRVPNKHKNRVRRAKKTTFIVKNQAFRIAKPKVQSSYIQKLTWFYSTSANKSGKHFEREFCVANATMTIEDKNSLYETSSSRLLKINNISMQVLR